MYLKSIIINNYKSIQKAQIDLEPGLNIIIGKNGAGKSNLLSFINKYVSNGYIEVGIGSIDKENIEFEYTVGDLNFELTVYVKNARKVAYKENNILPIILFTKKINGIIEYDKKTYFEISDSTKRTLVSELKSCNFRRSYIAYNTPLNSFWLGALVNYEISEYGLNNNIDSIEKFDIIYHLEKIFEKIFSETIENMLHNFSIDEIKNNCITAFNQYKEDFQLDHYLSSLTPISEIRLSPNINIYKVENKILINNLLIDFKVNGEWMPWSYLSDGTKRLFYLITQCLSIEEGLVIIEEPELGIYPDQLFLLMNFLKEQAQYKQIIIATHSPSVLDVLEPDELNSINIAKMTPQGTQFTKLDERQINKAKTYIKKVGALSYYWLHSDLIEHE